MIIEHFETDLDKGIMVSVTQREACDLIASLANQLTEGNANSRRLESFDRNGNYFSISVHSDEEYEYLDRQRSNNKSSKGATKA